MREAYVPYKTKHDASLALCVTLHSGNAGRLLLRPITGSWHQSHIDHPTNNLLYIILLLPSLSTQQPLQKKTRKSQLHELYTRMIEVDNDKFYNTQLFNYKEQD